MDKQYDVVIVGTGAAGLYAAISFPRDVSVLLLSKRELPLSNSSLAQGGVACVLDTVHDAYKLHISDTLIAGKYKNTLAAVEKLVKEGPADVMRIKELGVDWLRNQVKLIRPKIIVCLGRIAAARIIKPDIKITREHGQFIEKNGVLMMAMLHPAAILRDPRKKPEAFNDFLILREKINEICEHTY